MSRTYSTNSGDGECIRNFGSGSQNREDRLGNLCVGGKII
jgi:hypothetical protein